MAPGPSCWPALTPMPTRPGSWIGWSRSTPPWSGCTSTGRARGGSAATRPRSHPMTRRTAQRAVSARGASPNDKNSHPEPLIGEPDDHAIGRSRGGLTTKVHALTDGHGRVLVFRLTGGNVHDSRAFAALLDAVGVPRSGAGRPRTRPDYLLADKAYSSRAARILLRGRGIPHTIAEPDDQKANRRRKGSAGGRPVGFNAARYAQRNTIERGFCQLKQWRGLATRYDKHATNYAAAVTFVALLGWLP